MHFAFRNVFIAACVLLGTQMAFAKTLYTYDQIADSLAAAVPVYLSVDVKKCSLGKGMGNATDVTRVGIKLSSLYERKSDMRGKENMRMMAGGPGSGLFGDHNFQWTRDLALVFEDGTVMIIEDNVDPRSFKLLQRTWINCTLSADGSGGVRAIQMGF